MMDDAQFCIVAYGTTARIAKNAVVKARREFGIKAGSDPADHALAVSRVSAIAKAAKRCKAFVAVEMSTGQMVEDVRLAVNGARPVSFIGTTGGIHSHARPDH